MVLATNEAGFLLAIPDSLSTTKRNHADPKGDRIFVFVTLLFALIDFNCTKDYLYLGRRFLHSGCCP